MWGPCSLFHGLKRKVGDGRLTTSASTCFNNFRLRVSDLINWRTWRTHLLSFLFPSDVLMEDRISYIHIPLASQSDKVFYNGTRSGLFSVEISPIFFTLKLLPCFLAYNSASIIRKKVWGLISIMVCQWLSEESMIDWFYILVVMPLFKSLLLSLQVIWLRRNDALFHGVVYQVASPLG